MPARRWQMPDGLRDWLGTLRSQAYGFVYSTAEVTRNAPLVRSAANAQTVWNTFVLASVPACLMGLWSVGHQANLAIAQLQLRALPGWRAAALEHAGIGFEASSVSACFIHGSLWFLPVFLTALATGALWQAAFAVARRRPVDDGLLYTAWFFALLLPATVPLYLVALGMSFGIVIGKLIFGGSGRYLVNPALLGAAFLVFSYPALVFDEGAWVPVPGFGQPSVLELVLSEGGVNAAAAVGYTWQQVFLGHRPGAFGTTSVLGVLLGAVFLVYARVASWRVMLGALVGLIATTLLFNAVAADNPLFSLPWYWHAVLGGFAFGVVFLATDPVAGAMTHHGRWGFGLMVGALTVVISLANPVAHEGMVFAILLASVFAPLIDYAVVAHHARRRQPRLSDAHD